MQRVKTSINTKRLDNFLPQPNRRDIRDPDQGFGPELCLHIYTLTDVLHLGKVILPRSSWLRFPEQE
jgi:hypothetical protein